MYTPDLKVNEKMPNKMCTRESKVNEKTPNKNHEQGDPDERGTTSAKRLLLRSKM